MNWTYLRVEALLPLALALGATLVLCVLFAFRLHWKGGSSQVARRRFLLFAARVFPVAFLLASLYDARDSLRGLWGVVRHQADDEYALGLLRRSGQGFLVKDPAKAAAWFRKAAEQGHPEAQYALAQACLSGRGVPKDPREGLRWSLASAGRGNTDGMLLSGDILRAIDPPSARRLYQQALTQVQSRAVQGDAEAAFTLGQMYLRGQGLDSNLVEGLAWMLVAGHRGISGEQKVLLALEAGMLTPSQRTAASQRARVLEGAAEGRAR